MAVRQILPASEKLKKLSVVVPAFNERDNLATLLAELKAFAWSGKLQGFVIDIVLVDDGSADDTASLSRSMGIKTLSLPFNLGIGVAVQTGFQYALSQGADFVVQVDGDGQHIPDEIIKLTSSLHSDVTIGSRYIGKSAENSSTSARKFGGQMLSWLLQVLTGLRVTDPTSGFRIYNHRAAQFVAENYPDDYPEAEVLVTLAMEGFKISEASVRMRTRKHGKSSIKGLLPAYYMLKVFFASWLHRVRAC